MVTQWMSIDGALVQASQAQLPAGLVTASQGQAWFETLRVMDQRVARGPRHVRRALRTAQMLGVQVPEAWLAWAQELADTLPPGLQALRVTFLTAPQRAHAAGERIVLWVVLRRVGRVVGQGGQGGGHGDPARWRACHLTARARGGPGAVGGWHTRGVTVGRPARHRPCRRSVGQSPGRSVARSAGRSPGTPADQPAGTQGTIPGTTIPPRSPTVTLP
jgi:hypothetical protein